MAEQWNLQPWREWSEERRVDFLCPIRKYIAYIPAVAINSGLTDSTLLVHIMGGENNDKWLTSQVKTIWRPESRMITIVMFTGNGNGLARHNSDQKLVIGRRYN